MRPLGATQSFSPLGRETFITDVAWADGWPQPEPVLLAPRTGVEVEDFDFADPSALDDPGWMAVRTLPAEVASLTSTPGRLTIVGDGSTLDDSHPRFVGRRQRHITLDACRPSSTRPRAPAASRSATTSSTTSRSRRAATATPPG